MIGYVVRILAARAPTNLAIASIVRSLPRQCAGYLSTNQSLRPHRAVRPAEPDSARPSSAQFVFSPVQKLRILHKKAPGPPADSERRPNRRASRIMPELDGRRTPPIRPGSFFHLVQTFELCTRKHPDPPETTRTLFPGIPRPITSDWLPLAIRLASFFPAQKPGISAQECTKGVPEAILNPVVTLTEDSHLSILGFVSQWPARMSRLCLSPGWLTCGRALCGRLRWQVGDMLHGAVILKLRRILQFVPYLASFPLLFRPPFRRCVEP